MQTGCGVSLASGVGVRVGWVDKVSVGGNVATWVAGADGSNEHAEMMRMIAAARPYLRKIVLLVRIIWFPLLELLKKEKAKPMAPPVFEILLSFYSSRNSPSMISSS